MMNLAPITSVMNQNEFVLSQRVDLTACDKEPIHTPGAIQPHGLLFVLQEPHLHILQASNNTLITLGMPPQALLGKSLKDLVGLQQFRRIKKNIIQETEVENPFDLFIKIKTKKLFFTGIIHRENGILILELEPNFIKGKRNLLTFYQLIQAPLIKIQKASSLNELYQTTVKELRKMTDFDRVIVYQFDAEGAGTVIAEDKLQDLNPYLGLRYPPSYIPKQARQLYTLNLLRLIPDVNYQPVELVPVCHPVTHQPTDLSFSIFRSVSPIHIEYLKNMGVNASMSISLVVSKKLWGVIACHHQSPKYVSYEIRMACELLGKFMALELASKENNERLDERIKLNSIQAKLVGAILQEEIWKEGLLKQRDNLLGLVGARGAAVWANNDLTLVGQTPSLADIYPLMAWLATNSDQDIFYTDSLSKLYPAAEKFKDVASGLLAISISKQQNHYILWFRPESIQTINWVGNPHKQVGVDADGGLQLLPPKSFELWEETIRFKSLPWKPCEIEIAQELRSAIVGIVLRKADELAKVNQQLTLALEAAQMGIWDWDLLTHHITWSSSHEHLFGFAPGAFQGTYEAFESRVHPDDRDAIALAVHQACLNHQDYYKQFRVVWADGSIHWIEGKGKFLYDAEGRAVRMLGTVVDITARKKAEKALQESQHFIQQIADTAPNLIYIMDIVQQRNVYLNRYGRQLFGRSSEELQGLGLAFFAEAVHPDDFYKIHELAERFATAKDGEVLEDELRMKDTSGEWRWFHTWDVVFSRTKEGLPKQILGTAIDITQAKKLDEARHQAEQQICFQAGLLNAVEQAVIATDLAGNIIYWNRYAEILYGWQATEALGRSILDVTPTPQFQEHAREIIARLQAGESWSGEFLVQRRDGSLFPAIVIDSPIYDEHGKWIGIVGVSVDISDRKKIEATLQQLNEELELRVTQRTQELERSQIALQQQIEREHLIVAIAQQIRQSLDLEEILNTSVTEVQKLLAADRVLIYRVWPDGTGSTIAEAVAPGWIKILDFTLPEEVFPQECHQQYAEGRIYTLTDREKEEILPCLADFLTQIQVKAKLVVPIVQHDTLWGLLIAHQCSRPREWQPWEIDLLVSLANQMAIGIKQSELYQQLQDELRDRKLAEEALRQSEAQFRSLSENSPVGIFKMDERGQCIYTNPRYQAISDSTLAEALGDGWVQLIHPDDREWVLTEWSNVMSEQRDFLGEIRYVHKDGTIRFGRVRTSPLLNANGELIGYAGTVEDITETRVIEKMKNEFISIVSHELRTPLASIRGSLGLLAAGIFKNKPEATQQMLDIAASETERLVRLVNDILDLERLESHRVNLVKQWCDAATLIQRSVETLQSLTTESQITLSVVPTSVQVWADADRIIQTLVNLVSNAIKFSSSGSTVTLSVQDKADRVLFAIKDQGRGIPADKLDTIFGRFQQVDASDSRQKGGTGLGLAICKSIVQQHGGKIWVESVLGQGSTFYFTLPIPID